MGAPLGEDDAELTGASRVAHDPMEGPQPPGVKPSEPPGSGGLSLKERNYAVQVVLLHHVGGVGPTRASSGRKATPIREALKRPTSVSEFPTDAVLFGGIASRDFRLRRTPSFPLVGTRIPGESSRPCRSTSSPLARTTSMSRVRPGRSASTSIPPLTMAVVTGRSFRARRSSGPLWHEGGPVLGKPQNLGRLLCGARVDGPIGEGMEPTGPEGKKVLVAATVGMYEPFLALRTHGALREEGPEPRHVHRGEPARWQLQHRAFRFEKPATPREMGAGGFEPPYAGLSSARSSHSSPARVCRASADPHPLTV